MDANSCKRLVQRNGATFRVRDYRKGFETDAQSEFVQAPRKLWQTLGFLPRLPRLPAQRRPAFLPAGVRNAWFGARGKVSAIPLGRMKVLR